MTIRVVVADDQEIVRSGFSALLETQADIVVVGSAADGAEALRLCREQRPDVVLIDVRMPTMDGIEATRQLAADRRDGPRVLILTTFDLDEYVFPALRADDFTHAWGGPLGIPRDWHAGVGLRADGVGWAGGYVGDGVGTSHLAGRTLAALVLGFVLGRKKS